MNRRLTLIIAALALTAGVVLYFLPGAPRPAPAPVTSKREAPAPAPVHAAPSPAPEKASPEPERREARRRTAPAPKPAPVPPPAASTDAGVLHISSDVAGAEVFIDRVFIGAAPVTADHVTPGSHRLNVSAPGWDGVAETVDVAPGPRDIVVKLKVVRLDAAIDVIHKHRFGSCRGRLIATPQGMRYETTDKGDAFGTTPLVSLQTFEVDYLAKNLRVKLPGGKKYDFTDPDGNADHLFVFHRDVDKARARLKKGDPPAGS